MTDKQVPDLSAVASPPRQSLTYEDLKISEEPLGAGGQAVVYEATVSGSETPSKVALKEPKPGGTLTTEVYESLRKEADNWQTIDRREREKPRWSEYEHIVGIVDTGGFESGESAYPWIAMEYMDGGDLENRVANAPDGLPVDEALWIGECLCRGLEIADEYGYSHLDVKPKNILFRETPEGTWDVPKLGDWGIARTLAEETGTMEAKTITYSAPEQFDPEIGDPDSLTDLYQVGAVVYAMLTGEPPYTGSHQQIMRQVLDDEPVPPSQHRTEVSEAIDVVVTTALAKAKTDRHRGLQHFEEALRAIRTDSSLPTVIANQIEPSTTEGQTIPNKKEEWPPHTSETDISTEDGNTTWPMLQTDLARSGHLSHATGPTGEVTESWRVETGQKVISSPAVVNGNVYVGSWSGIIYSLNAKTGNTNWFFDTESRILSSPTIIDSNVYFGDNSGQLWALDATTGREQWCFKSPDNWVASSPAVIRGSVYVGSSDKKVYAVDARTGKEQWSVETGRRMKSPSVVDGTLYIGSETLSNKDHKANVYALDAATGEEQWRFETDRPFYTSPAVVGGTVYIGNSDGNVYAIDAKAGEQQWRFKDCYRVYSSPAVVDSTVYVGTRIYGGGAVYALDAATGEEQWAFETGDSVNSSPAVVDDTVYVGSDDGNVYALDTATGEEQWAFETGDSVKSSPAVVDDTVYVGSNDGNMYALK